MCRISSASLQSIVRLWPDSDTGDMLPQRCPTCGCAEEGAAEAPRRFQMRLQRTVRLIFVSLVLLLGVTLAALVVLLFGSPVNLRQRGQPAIIHTAPEAGSERLQAGNDLSYSSVLLTIKEQPDPGWQYAEGNAHKRGNMILDDGILRVPSDGLYRLYLQITFEFLKNNDSDMCVKDLLKLKITVDRFSKSYPAYRELLVSEETMSCTHDWTKSMFVSGSFELDADSQLRVEIQHHKLINPQDTHSFFGVEWIST